MVASACIPQPCDPAVRGQTATCCATCALHAPQLSQIRVGMHRKLYLFRTKILPRLDCFTSPTHGPQASQPLSASSWTSSSSSGACQQKLGDDAIGDSRADCRTQHIHAPLAVRLQTGGRGGVGFVSKMLPPAVAASAPASTHTCRQRPRGIWSRTGTICVARWLSESNSVTTSHMRWKSSTSA
jgi:hypothetical protein